MKIVQISAFGDDVWPGVFALTDTGRIFRGGFIPDATENKCNFEWEELPPIESSQPGADYSVTEQVEGS